MEKEDLMEALATDLLERKALDLILDSATYEDYEWKAEEQGSDVATVEAGALTEDQATRPGEDRGEAGREVAADTGVDRLRKLSTRTIHRLAATRSGARRHHRAALRRRG